MLWDKQVPLPVVSIINQVLVSEDDPDYQDPSKPVGPFYTKEEAEKLGAERPEYVIKEVKPENVERRFRRVVPSPEPIRNIEYLAIRRMLDSGIVIIASGGGGIPVVFDENKIMKGTAAVIDKNKAGEVLVTVVGADVFLVLTDVAHAKINFGQPDEKDLGRISCSEMRRLAGEGHFKAGSMGPKVEACLRFIEWGGQQAIITSLDNAIAALRGESCTRIVPDGKA
ncbi:MAG: hypothetical protein U9N73_10730 [Candidatus Auribacterota bacterium]|nr:hypothetical protein [Candidatus Auribacterota bacterium]